ncbi:MAG: hypothetical protein ABR567_09460, partial [Myxococcales bacterium]
VEAEKKAADEQARIDDAQLAKGIKNLEAAYRAHQKYLNDVSKAEFDAAKALEKMYDDQLNYKLTRNKKEEKSEDETNKKWVDGIKSAVGTVGAALHQNVMAVLQGTESISQAFQNMGWAIVDAMVGAIVKVAEEWVAAELTKLIVGKAANISSTQGNIAVAATGAAAAMAAIPIVGPALAVDAAGSMMTFLEALSAPLLSAAGGFDIPFGVNPIVQAHAREMILPADIAEPLRSMVREGGGGDGMHLHFHFDGATDGESVRRFVEGDKFQRAVGEAMRNGRWPR